jgi:gag-polyprotein putative aspartyl protease
MLQPRLNLMYPCRNKESVDTMNLYTKQGQEFACAPSAIAVQEKRLPMLKIQVSINGHDMVALVDCGCEATIISHPCADKLGVKRNPVGDQAEHWNGTLTSLEEVDAPIIMELGDNVRHDIHPCISLAVAYDLILGMDLLSRYNPHINWQRNRLILYNTRTRRRCIIEATDVTTKRPDYLVSAKQIARLAKKELPTYILHMRETDDEVPEDSDFHPNNKPETAPVEDGKTTFQGKMKSLLQGYKDIFPEDLPSGLAPKRSVELKIDLVPGSEPVKRQIYKLSAEEFTEVKKQVDLLMKGFTDLAQPHGAAPSSSSPRTMEVYACCLTIEL